MDEQQEALSQQSPEPISPEPEYTPEPPAGSYDEPLPPDDGGPEPEVSVDENGEVNFSDDFFGDVSDEPQGPNYYTAEELQNTPYEQWDASRLHGDIQDFLPIVREQMQKRAMYAQLNARPENPPFMQPVQPYTPKELADEAQMLAVEKLGLEDPDDFDEYEGEHRAALNLAMQELSQRRNAEVANYQRSAQEYQNLRRFNMELSMRPDFNEFDRWMAGKLQAKGLTAQHLERGLEEYARRSNGNYAVIQGVIAGWYREFHDERGGGSSPVRRSTCPPVLESTRGGMNYDARRGVNLRDFGEMDADSQAQALMRMGLV